MGNIFTENPLFYIPSIDMVNKHMVADDLSRKNALLTILRAQVTYFNKLKYMYMIDVDFSSY